MLYFNKKTFSKIGIGLVLASLFLSPANITLETRNNEKGVSILVENNTALAAPATQAQKDAYKSALTLVRSICSTKDPKWYDANKAFEQAYGLLLLADDGAAVAKQIDKAVPDPCTANTLPGGGTGTSTKTTYRPLAPLTDELDGPYETATDCPLGKYLGILFNLFMGIAAVLAMVMIFAGGIEYMGSELISSKEAGMSKVKNAIGGLLLALAAYLILDTINPKLLDVCLNIKDVSVTIEPLSNSVNDMPSLGTAGDIARCSVLTSGPCAPSNLGIFGAKAEAMSKICHVESGGKADNESGTDKGTDLTPFSFGLFQINLLRNGEYLDKVLGQSSPGCTGLFQITNASGNSPGGTSIPPAGDDEYIKKENGKYKYNAKLKEGPAIKARYDACVAKLKDPATNLAVAKILFDIGSNKWGNMSAWNGDYCVCASAFDKGSKECK